MFESYSIAICIMRYKTEHEPIKIDTNVDDGQGGKYPKLFTYQPQWLMNAQFYFFCLSYTLKKDLGQI